MNKKKTAILFVILAASLWGTLGLNVRVLAHFGFSSIQIVLTRFLVSAIFLGIYLLITDKEKLKAQKSDFKWFMGTGIFSMLFFNTCYTAAVQITSLSVAAVLLYTSPVFVTLLSIPIFKEKLTVKKAFAMICSVVGCALVSGILSSKAAAISGEGILLGIGAAVGYAFYGIFARILIQRYHSLTILFYTFLLAGIGGLFAGDSKGIVEIVVNTPMAMVAVVVVSLTCSVIPYILYTTALRQIEVSKVSIIASIEPVVATLLGVWIFREPLSVNGVAGIACVLFAIGILNTES
ncbi:Hypothetical protein LUCI_2475 [Lucifera butyrica]|uniref:EamA domain-containing protein n=1 Tax=Lucifera butyrica TaxID=1351585 RepID=A0A498R782_9FIRM|nr:EamA family transporter [Lucifera butyrica]VBB07231.1 Hypothetical protein LUCI_2475 [Lucifera butyrica]